MPSVLAKVGDGVRREDPRMGQLCSRPWGQVFLNRSAQPITNTLENALAAGRHRKRNRKQETHQTAMVLHFAFSLLLSSLRPANHARIKTATRISVFQLMSWIRGAVDSPTLCCVVCPARWERASGLRPPHCDLREVSPPVLLELRLGEINRMRLTYNGPTQLLRNFYRRSS
jgi:hypothetical protein